MFLGNVSKGTLTAPEHVPSLVLWFTREKLLDKFALGHTKGDFPKIVLRQNFPPSVASIFKVFLDQSEEKRILSASSEACYIIHPYAGDWWDGLISSLGKTLSLLRSSMQNVCNQSFCSVPAFKSLVIR